MNKLVSYMQEIETAIILILPFLAQLVITYRFSPHLAFFCFSFTASAAAHSTAVAVGQVGPAVQEASPVGRAAKRTTLQRRIAAGNTGCSTPRDPPESCPPSVAHLEPLAALGSQRRSEHCCPFLSFCVGLMGCGHRPELQSQAVPRIA